MWIIVVWFTQTGTEMHVVRMQEYIKYYLLTLFHKKQ